MKAQGAELLGEISKVKEETKGVNDNRTSENHLTGKDVVNEW